MENTSTLIVVAAALVDGEGRVLLQQRAPGKAMAGLWEFPGGKVEPGERPEAALVRELEEELGIMAGLGSLQPCAFATGDLGERHLLLLLYICRTWRGNPQPLDASALRWELPQAMGDLPMPSADAPLIPILEALV